MTMLVEPNALGSHVGIHMVPTLFESEPGDYVLGAVSSCCRTTFAMFRPDSMQVYCTDCKNIAYRPTSSSVPGKRVPLKIHLRANGKDDAAVTAWIRDWLLNQDVEVNIQH